MRSPTGMASALRRGVGTAAVVKLNMAKSTIHPTSCVLLPRADDRDTVAPRAAALSTRAGRRGRPCERRAPGVVARRARKSAGDMAPTAAHASRARAACARRARTRARERAWRRERERERERARASPPAVSPSRRGKRRAHARWAQLAGFLSGGEKAKGWGRTRALPPKSAASALVVVPSESTNNGAYHRAKPHAPKRSRLRKASDTHA